MSKLPTLIFLALFSLFSEGVAQHYSPVTRSKMNLTGPVKSIKKTSWFVDPKDTLNITKGSIYRGRHDRDDFSVEFDESGKEIRYCLMDNEKTRVAHTRTFSYDSVGRIIKEDVGSRPLKVYSYDSSSRLIRIFWPEPAYRPREHPTIDTFIYNSKNQLVEETRFEEGSGEVNKITTKFIYDNSGRVIKESSIFNNRPTGFVQISYETVKGNEKITRTTSSAGVNSGVSTVLLDSTGKEVENFHRTQREGNSLQRTVYSYDMRNNMLESKVYINGKLTEELTYVLEYDEKGNWIRKVIFENGKPCCIHEREIIYY